MRKDQNEEWVYSNLFYGSGLPHSHQTACLFIAVLTGLCSNESKTLILRFSLSALSQEPLYLWKIWKPALKR